MKQIFERQGRQYPRRAETLEFHRVAVNKAMQMMRKDPGATLDWNTLSEIACVSRFHFLRIFEGLTGVSPHRFLIALRIEKAKQLLLETAMEASEVCLAIGYSSVGTFTRVFRELVGIAPGGFRQLAAKLGDAGLQLLIAEHWKRQNHIIGRKAIRADLRAPQSFAGNIFVGLFNSQLQPLKPAAPTLARHSGLIAAPIPDGIQESRLMAIGFPDPINTSQYFLPGRHSPRAISPLIQSPPRDASTASVIPLHMRAPGIFDLPILTCLPLLLLNPAGTEDLAKTAG